MTKFTIRFDPETERYLTLSNNNPNPSQPSRRTVLSLHISEDLLHWNHKLTLLEDDQGLPHEQSVRLTGFQYVDWQFDSDDILYIVRTAYDGAHNYHDANRITFHQISQLSSVLL